MAVANTHQDLHKITSLVSGIKAIQDLSITLIENDSGCANLLETLAANAEQIKSLSQMSLDLLSTVSESIT